MTVSATVLVILLGICSILPLDANADEVLFDKGKTGDPRDELKWVGKLESIDPDTHLAKFHYYYNGEKTPYEVHVSRIYSWIKSDEVDHYNKLTRTRERIKTAITSDVTSPRRLGVVLSIDADLDVPSDARLSKDNEVMILDATVASADETSVSLRILTKTRTVKEQSVSRADFRSWRRRSVLKFTQ